MSKKDVGTVLARLRRRMDMLERLQRNLDNPTAGQLRDTISHVAVQGRSITNVLQNLRHIAPGFDEWYEPYRKVMEQDELLRFFYKLRTKSLKEGEDDIGGLRIGPGKYGGVVGIEAGGIIFVVNNPDGSKEKVFYPPPANVVTPFLFDDTGGVGWIVKTSDGSTSKEYVSIPPASVDISLLFSSPPQTHLGKAIEDCSARSLCILYVSYLKKLVKDAEGRFGGVAEQGTT